MVPIDNILQNHVYLIHVKKYLKGMDYDYILMKRHESYIVSRNLNSIPS